MIREIHVTKTSMSLPVQFLARFCGNGDDEHVDDDDDDEDEPDPFRSMPYGR